MARWAVSWLLLIAVATAAVYSGTNALISARSEQYVLTMQPLGGLGSPVCSRATRALVSVAAGSSADASPDDRDAWDRASSDVLQACAGA